MNSAALYKLSYGLYIVSSKDGDRLNGQTANTVFQICSDPPMLAVGINKENLTHEFIRKSRLYVVSVLAQNAPLSLIGHFGFQTGRKLDKFSGYRYQLSDNGVPYITESSLAYLAVQVTAEVDVKTHTVFIGEVTEAQVLAEGTPMTYAYYHQVKKGNIPKTAPTFEEKEVVHPRAEKYVCSVCGYVYDSAAGDPENNIAPGTTFSDLPDGWTCPVCGAGKEEFTVEV